MGGRGSGNWYRWDSKKTTDSQNRIDIRWLKKNGYLRPNTMGSLSWTCRGEQTGSINYTMKAGCMVLTYRNRYQGGDWQQIEQHVKFEETPCNYGGHRTWFICPNCGRRVALLYGAGKYFLCRHCYNLTYESQQVSTPSRLLLKVQNIRRRLGGSAATGDIFPERPKGMHWKTYSRLRCEAEQLDRLAWSMAEMSFEL